MKKIYIMLLVSVFALAGCSSSNENARTPMNSSQRNANNVKTHTNTATNNLGNDTRRMADNIGNGVERAVGGVENVVERAVGGVENAVDRVGNDMRYDTTRTNMSKDYTDNYNVPTDINARNYNSTTDMNTNNYNSTTGNYSANSNTRNSNYSQMNSSTEDQTMESSQRATKIARALNEIENVDKATVIITGDTALIGLNLSNNLTNEQITDIKKKAEQKAKSTDSAIKNATVTAAPEIVDRIVNLANDIGNGKPLSGLADEIGNLIRRITPF